MKRILIPAFALLTAAPAFADAEAFGERMLAQNGSNATAATMAMAVEKLSGDTVDERIPLGANEIVTRNSAPMTAGHLQLARAMGLNPNDYTSAELGSMYIDKYN